MLFAEKIEWKKVHCLGNCPKDLALPLKVTSIKTFLYKYPRLKALIRSEMLFIKTSNGIVIGEWIFPQKDLQTIHRVYHILVQKKSYLKFKKVNELKQIKSLKWALLAWYSEKPDLTTKYLPNSKVEIKLTQLFQFPLKNISK